LNLALALDGGQKTVVSEFYPFQRLLPAEKINYTAEAELVQQRAAHGQPSAIRIGSIVLFSTATGDAWVIEAQTGAAARLARAGEAGPIPIVVTPGKFDIVWEARYHLDDENFTAIEDDGNSETTSGYPVALIRHLIAEYPAECAGIVAGEIFAARERQGRTGRNASCPCGSGRKYKKCCLPLDESAVAKASEPVQRVELHATPLLPESDDANAVDDFFDFSDEAEPIGNEPELAPEVYAAVDRVWNDFNRHPNPTCAHLDALLDQLLALPFEATEWTEVLDVLAHAHHPDLAAAFRRIDRVIPPLNAAGPSYFYWNAIEKFVRRGQIEIVPEIARGFCRLDRSSYDADALNHLVYWMMAAGCDADALALQAYFLPIMRGDNNLMPHAVPSACRGMFELRVGQRLRELGASEGELEALARELRRDLEEEVHADFALRAAQVIRTEALPGDIRREDFDLPNEPVREGHPSWQKALRQFEALMHVAQEAWQTGGRSPGSAFRGLWLLVDSVYDEQDDNGRRQGRSPTKNLLDCLQLRGMERRIIRSTRDIMGTNLPHAYLLIEAHADLLRFAARCGLITETVGAKCASNLATLRNTLEFSVGSPTVDSDQ
jgi:hypothetical protein